MQLGRFPFTAKAPLRRGLPSRLACIRRNWYIDGRFGAPIALPQGRRPGELDLSDTLHTGEIDPARNAGIGNHAATRLAWSPDGERMALEVWDNRRRTDGPMGA